MSLAAALTDFAPGLEGAFARTPREGSYEIAVEGELPAFLKGSYYVNGPARFGRGGLRYRHWLDGDGMVAALHFAGGEGASGQGRVHFVNRFVRSTKLEEEEEAGKALYRTFGTSFEGDRLVHRIALASPVNVSVYRFGERLLAFGEQGLPWELDPVTLETRGQYTFGGRLNAISPFSAHPKIDGDTGELLNFGVSFASRQPCVHFYRFAADGELLLRRRLPLPYPASVHDFAVSEHYLLLYVSPYVLDVEALMAAGATVLDCLRWQPEQGSFLLVADRQTGEEVARLPIGRRYCLHLIEAFEDAGHLNVDVVELDQPVYDQYLVPELFPEVAPGRPSRLRIALSALSSEDRPSFERREIHYDRAPDFPHVDPRTAASVYDHLWLLGIRATGQGGRKFFDELAHLCWSRPEEADVYRAPEDCYLAAEPVFVPDPERKEAGAILCPQYDVRAESTTFLVFDALDVAAGPVARLPLESPLHLAFHASFHSD